MLETIYSQVGVAFAVIVVAFAFVKGDEPERIAAAAFALVVVASMVTPQGPDTGGPRWGPIGRDLVLIAVFAGLAWRSRRNWLVWALGFQSLILTGHVLVLANVRPPGDSFTAVNNMANYGLLIALAVGTFWAWQERRVAGMK